MKFAEYPLYRISRLLISRFDECWIPDHGQQPGLSGDLSHKYKLPGNARFIGPLSRFGNREPSGGKSTAERNVLAIISGPEPQRSIFEELVVRQLSKMEVTAMIVGGKPEAKAGNAIKAKPEILPYLATEQLAAAILSSSLIICRPGYSSVMDLQALGAKALFVPTPGQTEQEYLAGLYSQNGIAMSRQQENLDLSADLNEAMDFAGFKKQATGEKYKTVLNALQKK